MRTPGIHPSYNITEKKILGLNRGFEDEARGRQNFRPSDLTEGGLYIRYLIRGGRRKMQAVAGVTVFSGGI